MGKFTYILKLDKKGRAVLPIFIRKYLGDLILLKWDGERGILERAKEEGKIVRISKNGWEMRE